MAEAQVLAPTIYSYDLGSITDTEVKMFSIFTVILLGVMFIQWYIRRPRAQPQVMMCTCVSCKRKQPFQAYAEPGFHYREGTKLHYESVVPPSNVESKGIIIFLHGLLR